MAQRRNIIMGLGVGIFAIWGILNIIELIIFTLSFFGTEDALNSRFLFFLTTIFIAMSGIIISIWAIRQLEVGKEVNRDTPRIEQSYGPRR